MSANSRVAARFVAVTMGMVIGLTFLFGFGNVLNLALELHVPVLVAPLIAPAVDLTVLGLLVGTRHLAQSRASDEVMRPARRLLLAASVVTLLLNVADPVCAARWGQAAFDSVGPLLLIGWAETGPGLLRALSNENTKVESAQSLDSCSPELTTYDADDGTVELSTIYPGQRVGQVRNVDVDDELMERARRADAEHWRQSQRPISAEALRKQLQVGATKSRVLVAAVRAENAPAGTGGPG